MTRPIVNPDWATDAVYTNGPVLEQGTPTKVSPTAGARAEGSLVSQKPPAQHFNHALNAHGQYARLAAALDFNFDPIELVAFSPSVMDQGSFGALAFKPDSGLSFPPGHRFIMAHRTSNHVFKSVDGVSWSTNGAIEGGGNVDGIDHPGALFYSQVAGLFIYGPSAASVLNDIYTSPTGLTWTARVDPSGAGKEHGRISERTTGTAVIVLPTVDILRSTNGTTWVDVGLETTLTGMEFANIVSDGGGTLYMEAADYVLRSTDAGSNWEVIRVTSNLFPPFSLAYFDNRPILFGGSPTVGTLPAISLGMRVAPDTVVQF